MTGVIQAASELQRVCEAHRWQFCFIGGLALLRWGEPRETVDVDLTLLTGFGHEQPYIDTLTSLFEPRIADAAGLAIGLVLICSYLLTAGKLSGLQFGFSLLASVLVVTVIHNLDLIESFIAKVPDGTEVAV